MVCGTHPGTQPKWLIYWALIQTTRCYENIVRTSVVNKSQILGDTVSPSFRDNHYTALSKSVTKFRFKTLAHI